MVKNLSKFIIFFRKKLVVFALDEKNLKTGCFD